VPPDSHDRTQGAKSPQRKGARDENAARKVIRSRLHHCISDPRIEPYAGRLYVSESHRSLRGGTAVSREAGRLDVSLDLRCVNRRYEGELVTPVGTYIVKTGTYADGELQLQLDAGTDSVSVRVKLEQQVFHGQFTSGDDSGPLNLRRTGEAKASDSTNGSLQLSQQQWAADIDFFARELSQRHANAFHHLTREQFYTAIADVKRRLPQMNGDEVYVALDSIANAVGDAHTYIEFPPDMAKLPLDVRKFGADYRVVAVGTGFEKALGARVLTIGHTSIARARELAASMTPAAETTALADARIAGFLTMGITPHGAGIVSDRNVTTYTLEDDNGEKFTLSFHASSPNAQLNLVNLVKSPPLYRQNPDQDFWYVYLSEWRTLYCNFRGYQGLDQNAAALLREVKDRNPDKLVIDLRQNSGGDYNQGLKYLIDPIRLSKVNQMGDLFVLIGANTFSAAMSNAVQFRQRTAAMLVGEPIGERPNSYQEAREMRLPNSQLLVRYSTHYYKFTEEKENIIRPDREVLTGWKEYKAGRDPVLEWVLQYR
jgi:hypothetical protein